ncbi:hypothetical protein CBS101457_005434 [Exobasidium rhododendri]|nr:hypothetical protein CBS101457_005434 [Exobasidium rhododendri]
MEEILQVSSTALRASSSPSSPALKAKSPARFQQDTERILAGRRSNNSADEARLDKPDHESLPVKPTGQKRKPAPLDLTLSRLQAPLPPLPSSVHVAVKSHLPSLEGLPSNNHSPALIEARRRLQEQRKLNGLLQSPTSANKRPSLLATVAAFSHTLQPSASYSPPITAPAHLSQVAARTERPSSNDMLDVGEDERGRWAGSGEARITITSPPAFPAFPPTPLQRHTSFGLTVLATPSDLSVTPASPSGQVLQAGLADSSDSNPPSTGTLPGATVSSDLPSDLPRLPSGRGPAVRLLMNSRRNSFGIEEFKREDNEPSSAPALGAASRLAHMQEELSAPSPLSVAKRKQSKSSVKSAHSRLTISNSNTTSSLSLRSSMIRAQFWLNTPESPTAPMTYFFF